MLGITGAILTAGCQSTQQPSDASDVAVVVDSLDANTDGGGEDGSDVQEQDSPDVRTGPPPSEPLPPVRAGDLELRARTHGGYELSVGNRVLLASTYGPVAAQRWNERTETGFGNWRFFRTSEQEDRPASGASSTVDGDSLVLSVREGALRSELRFRRASPEIVEVRASITGAQNPKGTAVRFRCDPDSHFLGFGEQYNAVDHRGRKFALFVSEQGLGRDPARQSLFSGSPETTYYPLPFFLDPRGFGLMAETDARTIVDLCRASSDEYMIAPEQTEPILFRLYTGPTAADVMRTWTEYQGRTLTPPSWAVDGVWLGVQGGPDALRGFLRTAQMANVPVSVLWAQDWLGRKDLGLGNIDIRYHWTWDAMWYPNLAGLITEFAGQNVRFLGYFNPFVLKNEDQWAEAAREQYLPRAMDGTPYEFDLPHGVGSMVDLSNPRAVTWFKTFAQRAMDLGQVGWMQDYGEWLPLDCTLSDGRSARRYHNRYPVDWHRASSEALSTRFPSGDWVMFSRSGWLQDSRYSQIVWAGDQEASWSQWDGLPTVVPALVSLGLSGVGYVTHDIGGYFGGPSTKELYLRWIELGAFTPVMRTHEGLQRDRNWSWDRDAETLAVFSRFGRIHQALGPMFRALGDEHRRTGMPIVRAMGLAFATDPRTYAITDQFMLGDQMLVAPVVVQGQTARRVYFPAGRWHSVWDPMLVVDGPIEREVPAPMGSPPVFTRAPRADLAAIR
jgi:alpha-glucosidase